jgi:hypothetical protein
MTEKADGGRGSFETSEQDQPLIVECGRIGPVEHVEVISGVPAPTLRTYFVRSGDTIKIGRSYSPIDRIKNLGTGMPTSLETLAIIPADIIHERTAHEKFRHLRLNGEWFRAEPELLAFIETLKDQLRQYRPKRKYRSTRAMVNVTFTPRDLGADADQGERIASLMATRRDLVKVKREHPDEGARSRADILIQNIDNLKRALNDEPLLRQFAINQKDFARWLADLERYKADRGRV